MKKCVSMGIIVLKKIISVGAREAEVVIVGFMVASCDHKIDDLPSQMTILIHFLRKMLVTYNT